MNTKVVIDFIALIVVVALGIYQIYKSTKNVMKHVNGRKEFLEMNKETMTDEFLEHKTWCVVCALLSVASFVGGIYFFATSEDYLYAVSCISLGLILIGYVMDAFVTRRSWYYETGFFFEHKFHRYRSLAHVGPRKGLFPSYDVRFHSNPDMVVTRRMGEKLLDKQAEFKKIKKEKKKAGDK